MPVCAGLPPDPRRCRRSFQLLAGGGDGQPPVLDAFRRDQHIGNLPHYGALAAHHQHFQAMIVVQMDVQRGEDGMMVIVHEREQKYEYVPGLVGVNENLSSVSSAFDLNRLSLLTTVCGMSSRFFQVIRVPVFTVTVTGVKLKLSIVISPPDAPPSCEAAKTPRGAAS